MNIYCLSKRNQSLKTQGFTLVELMITMVISSFIIAALYSAYVVQQKSATAQEQVTFMQQNIRAGMNMLVSELRYVGFDPAGNSGATLVSAEKDAIIFTADFEEDGDLDGAGEHIGYDRYYSNTNKAWVLGRESNSSALTMTDEGGGHYQVDNSEAVAEYIEELEFLYIDEDGNSTTDPTAAEIQLIRTIQISILARAGYPDPKFTSTKTYSPASALADSTEPDWGPYPDNYRRRLQITTVQLRNMGL